MTTLRTEVVAKHLDVPRRALDRVCGGMSMVPTVWPGDEVHLSPHRQPRRGDVVVFEGQGNYDVVHRFIFKLPLLPYFVHRGDASNAQVGLARWDRIVGVAALPKRSPTLGEVLAGCSLVVRTASRRLVITNERRQSASQ